MYGKSPTSFILRQLVVMTLAASVDAHGYLTCPLPRMYREPKPLSWTNWMGISTPGDGAFNGGVGNAPNLNANIPGGDNGAIKEQTVGHGICGDIMPRNAFTATSGLYGPTVARGTFVSGGIMSIKVKITAWHGGHMEFRLCNPAGGGSNLSSPVTQECLNQNVLKISPTTPEYPSTAGHGSNRLDYQNLNSGVRCGTSAGYNDPTSTTPNTVWPSGSCCHNGGNCSDPTNSDDRWVLPSSSTEPYEIHLIVPTGLQCDRCVLQWFYQTGNSIDHYPESFWNCADVKILPEGSTSTTGCDFPGVTADASTTAPQDVTQPTGTAIPPAVGSPRCGTSWSDATTSCKSACLYPSDCAAGENCFADVSYTPCEGSATTTESPQDVTQPTGTAIPPTPPPTPPPTTPPPTVTTTTRCGHSWTDANTQCKKDCTRASDCPHGEGCFAGVRADVCITTTVPATITDQTDPASITLSPPTTAPPTTPPTTSPPTPPLPQPNSPRCGTSWSDATTSCKSACLYPSDCAAGENCFAGVSFDPCENSPRCGTSWSDATTSCKAMCRYPSDCAPGENCFAGVSFDPCA